MKLIVSVFWISLLLAFNSFGQKYKMYGSLEEALTAPVDSVYRLDLSKGKLTEVPKEIYRFKNLQELNLSKNKLTSLPDDMKFSDLRILDVSRNKFEKFPAAICQNTALRNLFMGKNEIESIPDCIGDLQDLQVFDIWFNPLDGLPETMSKLRNLRSLDLSGINFTKDEQLKITNLIPWVQIEFDTACNCN
ncbi:leucine-rich repeat domain-containing protein [Paracrocinitomix mangrovi]|uniref:leucine-rich repeat domain-containing protein n=1 Tax=Paracrocinitomix mangrovi TaxID=2862509 RepID=UPI001C8D09EF|nr:leucine-rich repeat domain-containing protein [Paracrocinitomix mangrovi]UKN03590.1 leucine-rich repeat domain-containing protein [Paracrocinitomix mangrovi]